MTVSGPQLALKQTLSLVATDPLLSVNLQIKSSHRCKLYSNWWPGGAESNCRHADFQIGYPYMSFIFLSSSFSESIVESAIFLNELSFIIVY